MVNIYLTKGPSQTKKIGEVAARNILKQGPLKKAVILGLVGDLGGGKTTFLQGFARGLGTREKILSPTFVIMRRYKIQDARHKMQNFYHVDCYRLEHPKEILDLGFKKIISNPWNIVAIEWADKIKKIFPKDSLIIRFRFVDKNTRKIIIKTTKNGK